MTSWLDSLRNAARSCMRRFVAKPLNTLTKGKLSPNAVTLTGLAMHIPIAVLIAQGYLIYAGILLIIFGLFDTLDGELARLQKRDSPAGMVLDASTDRMKEVFLYLGAAAYFVNTDQAMFAIWAVGACGGSLLVSYVKAKGETALKDSKLSANQINRVFQDGFFRFEVRMALLILGLFLNALAPVVMAIAILSWFTAMQRLLLISKKLS